MTTTAMRPGASRPRAAIAAKTLRTDRWWVGPLGIGLILAFFVVYSSIRIFMARYYWVDDYHYLTPLYSPCLSDSCAPGSSHFGTPIGELPAWIPLGLAAFPIVAGFRVTCYYYRKAYYRSFWLSPPACGVAEPHKKYTGETRFPLLVQNFHRYFFYLAALVLAINAYDATLALFPDGFGVGVGSIIIWINVFALAGYTLSCHACRHVVGGRLKHFSRHPVRYRFWTFVSKLNARHGTYAMVSLVTVILTDAYIMSVSAGWLTDLRLYN